MPPQTAEEQAWNDDWREVVADMGVRELFVLTRLCVNQVRIRRFLKATPWRLVCALLDEADVRSVKLLAHIDAQDDIPF